MYIDLKALHQILRTTIAAYINRHFWTPSTTAFQTRTSFSAILRRVILAMFKICTCHLSYSTNAWHFGLHSFLVQRNLEVWPTRYRDSCHWDDLHPLWIRFKREIYYRKTGRNTWSIFSKHPSCFRWYPVFNFALSFTQTLTASTNCLGWEIHRSASNPPVSWFSNTHQQFLFSLVISWPLHSWWWQPRYALTASQCPQILF